MKDNAKLTCALSMSNFFISVDLSGPSVFSLKDEPALMYLHPLSLSTSLLQDKRPNTGAIAYRTRRHQVLMLLLSISKESLQTTP